MIMMKEHFVIEPFIEPLIISSISSILLIHLLLCKLIRRMNKVINAKVALKKPADIRGMGPELLPGELQFVPGTLY